jgi:L-lactate dehydrogenase
MENKKTESTRVVIVGTGFVGSTAAFAIMTQGIASEIVLIDVNKDKCEGEAMDLEHGLSFVPSARVWAGDYTDCADADVVVITAGVGQKVGQTRLDLAGTNASIMREIVKNVARQTKDAIILVVSNPLDVMTYVALKESGFPKNQVFGTGTTLDSSRFRLLLGEALKVDPDSVGAYVLGEHGDSEFPVVSHANVMGESIKNISGYSEEMMREAFKKTKNAAYDVICKKGATYYAIALGIARITRAILNNEQHTFPVSVFLDGEYGLCDVCLSVPAVIGRSGVERIIEISLSDEEHDQLKNSARVLQEVIQSVV